MPHSQETLARLRDMWRSVPLSDVLRAQWKSKTDQVVSVPSNVPVETAFDLLVRHSINAAPVLDPSTGNYVGMVSMHDVLEYVITLVQANKQVLQELDAHPADNIGALTSDDAAAKGQAPDPGAAAAGMPPPQQQQQQQQHSSMASTEESRGIAIEEIVKRVRQVRAVPVAYISDLSSRDPYHALPLSGTLDQAIDIFVKGVHRIVITDATSDKKLVGIISQSDLLHYICQHEKDEAMAEALRAKISDLGLSEPKEIIHVKAFQHVIDALQAMHQHRLSSVAVVDPNSRLLGNISATDVKHIMRHLRYGVLFDTCSQFINKVKTRQMLENAGKDIVPVIQVSPHASLQQVVRLMMVTHVHRVWVTEQNPATANFQAPLSVVSMTDILRALI
ncbi:cell separation during budding [Sorochytrium milnesiophthora]